MLIELFSLGVMAESPRAKRDRKSAISLQRGYFDPKFQVEGVAPQKSCFARLVKCGGWQFSHKETLWQTFFKRSAIFYGNRPSCVFETAFGRLRGNVRRSS